MSRVTQQRSFEESASGNARYAAWDECDFEPGSDFAALPPRAVPRDDVSQSQMGWLLSTIETDIIPRLLASHRAAPVALARPTPAALRAPAAAAVPDADTVPKLAALILANDAGAATAFVRAIQAGGVPLEVVYLEVLAPVARHLGMLWEDDLCDFTQVTVALWRIQQLMYEFSPAFQDDTHGVNLHRSMLVPVPGSQHTLGLLMVAEFFRRAGWVVWGDPSAHAEDLVQAARTQWFDLVGFSVGTEAQLGALAQVIRSIRKASLNPQISVMVGGPVFVAHPHLVAQVGADATAADASKAVACAAALLASRQPAR